MSHTYLGEETENAISEMVDLAKAELEKQEPAAPSRKKRGPYKPRAGKAKTQTPEQIAELAFMTLSRAHDTFALPTVLWGNGRKLEALAVQVKEAMRILQPLALRAAAKGGDE